MKKTFGTFLIAGVLMLLCINAFAYEYFWFQVQDEKGNPVTYTSATVYTEGTSTVATLYDSRQGTSAGVANPIVTSTNGVFSFWGNKSTYDVQVRKDGNPTLTFNGFTQYDHSIVITPSKVFTVKNIVCDRWLAPAATDTDVIEDTKTINTTVFYSNTVSLTITSITQPAYPRNITWGCTDITSGVPSANPGNTIYLIVCGKDAKGNYITENIQAGSTTLTTVVNSGTGQKAFSRIDSVAFSTGLLATQNLNTATYFIGVGDTFGLTHDIYGDTGLKCLENALDVYKTYGINGTYDTYNPVATPNGTLNLELYYRTKEVLIKED